MQNSRDEMDAVKIITGASRFNLNINGSALTSHCQSKVHLDSSPRLSKNSSSVMQKSLVLPMIKNKSSVRKMCTSTMGPMRSTSVTSCTQNKLASSLSDEGAVRITENIMKGNFNQSRIVKYLMNQSNRHKIHALASSNLQQKFNSGNNS